MKINPLIAVAVPTWGDVSFDWARNYKHIGGPLGSNTVELAPVVGKPIDVARNELMQAAFDNECDFIFFIGDDTLPAGDSLIKLLQRMWDNPEINMVTGVYWTKSWPTQPYIWRGMQRGPYMDWKLGEFFEVDFAGIDCLLIRLTPEMKDLGPDWFSLNWTWEDGSEEKPALLATEDFYFYTRARKAGMKLYCDTNVQCLHQDRHTKQMFGLTQDMPQAGGDPVTLPDAKTEAAPLVKLADIGCGFDAPYFGHAEEVKIVRFDGNEKAKPDYRCDIRRLPVPDQSFDMVHSRHVLEHFGRDEVIKVLKEWTRILRVGGEFRLSVPNFLSAIRNIILAEEGVFPSQQYWWWQVYGAQADEYDIHKNGFTPKRLQLLMERLGIFEDIEVTSKGGEEDDQNLYVTAKKVRHDSPYALLPDWADIEATEDIKVPGIHREKEQVTLTFEVPGPERSNGKAKRPSKNGHKKKSPIKAPVLKGDS